ncbi:hypothetical protein QBC34DRAFT_429144 [Podospora aff. communis PSN243]|uniref:Uncharacterized protein n=1 Tax=Podospora aff. communis PSN243 TaxID=3040156 RepID=A0AAV9GDA6_9PEZI|nr:hypothetical protein QBC34DRAFT_429144 [Podospora aff. communis PSN243]
MSLLSEEAMQDSWQQFKNVYAVKHRRIKVEWVNMDPKSGKVTVLEEPENGKYMIRADLKDFMHGKTSAQASTPPKTIAITGFMLGADGEPIQAIRVKQKHWTWHDKRFLIAKYPDLDLEVKKGTKVTLGACIEIQRFDWADGAGSVSTTLMGGESAVYNPPADATPR